MNKVSCGNCGEVFLVADNQQHAVCQVCWFESDISDFPDKMMNVNEDESNDNAKT